MPRSVHILTSKSRLFPAPWALWIPSQENTQVGKIIQAIGDTTEGFEVEFVRNYNLITQHRPREIVFLASIDEKYIVDTPGDGSKIEDRNAVDDIERRALSIPTPGKSLASVFLPKAVSSILRDGKRLC